MKRNKHENKNKTDEIIDNTQLFYDLDIKLD